MSLRPILAVIPARGGSKGLPGKNIRLLAGLPLIAHSIRLAALCPDIDRCIVSTDSQEIADVARAHGGDVPFLRPAELARDESPSWPALQHALIEAERIFGQRFGSLLELAPTSPARLPEDVVNAVELLEPDSRAVGVVAVSEPQFNPRWVCVEERDGYMVQSFDSHIYARRQDVPKTYRINGMLYLWKRDYVLGTPVLHFHQTAHRLLRVPEERAIDIDGLHDFQVAELLFRGGLLSLPGLTPHLPGVQLSIARARERTNRR